jgi:hypothetical protein
LPYSKSRFREIPGTDEIPGDSGGFRGFRGQTGRFRCFGLRVFVCELPSIHFDAHAFLLVGNVLEASNVIRGTLLEPFVAGNHDSSGQ